MKTMIHFLILLLLLTVSCRKDNVIEEITILIPDGKQIESYVRGVVVDEEGKVVSNAAISIGDETKNTDDNGVFISKNNLFENGSLVKVSKSGYFTTYKRLLPIKNQETYLKIGLVKKPDNVSTVLSSKGGKVNGINSESITFTANSFVVDETKSQYNGKVKVYSHYYDPFDVSMYETMPGNLQGITAEGEKQQLQSFGMILVELEGENGDKLNIKRGERADITMPIPNSLLKSAPEIINLWSLDEHTGLWIENGKAIKTGNRYEFEVSHFSTWNCDSAFPSIDLTGKLLSNDSNPLEYTKILISHKNKDFCNYNYSSKHGNFKIQVPLNKDLTLTVYNACDEGVHTIDIGSFSENTDLGNVLIPADDIIKIYGNIVDCYGSEIVDGYVQIELDGRHSIVQPVDTSGDFNFSILKCESNDIKVFGVDVKKKNVSKQIEFDISSLSELSTGQIVVCENLEEYITINFDGENYTFFEPTASKYSNQAYISSNWGGRYISFGSDNLDKLDHNVINLKYFIGMDFIINCTPISSSDNCNDLKVKFTEVGDLNEYIEGNSKGKIIVNGELKDIEIEFRSKISKVKESISGKVWLDINKNGIQDNGETGIEGIKIISKDGESNITDANGIYTIFSDPNPFAELEIETTNKYTLSPMNIGDDDAIDSDFDPITKSTGSFELDYGKPIVSIDAGLVSKPIVVEKRAYANCDGTSGCVELLFKGGAIGDTYNYVFKNTQTGEKITGSTSEDSIKICDFKFDVMYDVTIFSSGITIDQDVIEINYQQYPALELSFFSETVNCNPPSGNLSIIVNGGVKPYKYRWSTYPTFTTVNNIYSVFAGTYSVTVQDRVGCQQVIEENIDFETQFIKGSVWIENPLGVSDEKDSLDNYIEGVKIILKDNNYNTIEFQKTNSKGQYKFENIDNGEYLIEIELPTNYSLVKKHATTDFTIDSDADPITKQTDLFEVKNSCLLEPFIDFGLKKQN